MGQRSDRPILRTAKASPMQTSSCGTWAQSITCRGRRTARIGQRNVSRVGPSDVDRLAAEAAQLVRPNAAVRAARALTPTGFRVQLRVVFHISADSLITPHARSNSAILRGVGADTRGRPRRSRAPRNQPIVESLMIPFAMVMLDELLRSARRKWRSPSGIDPIETFFFDRPDEALGVGVGVSSRLHRQRAVRHKPFALPIPSIRSVAGRFR